VEDLEMHPDPARQKQQIQFRVKLRNDGKPVRANLRVQDRNEIVVQIENILLRRGMSEYEFPYTGYAFQRLDHCFTVVVDVEKSHYTVEAKRKFCARHITRPPGWTLQP
jgi:hypothetical protein